MNWSDIIIALISFAGACIGTIYGIHKSSSLTVYRIEQLEKKMDVHNEIQKRVLVMEELMREFRETYKSQHEIVTERLKNHGEEIDEVYSLAERNDVRITALENKV